MTARGSPTSIPCPCGQAARVVTGATIYPHREDLAKHRFFRCPVCEAFVGCHPDGHPKGTPADGPTRDARKRAHAAFDSVWRNGWRSRAGAYAWLAEAMGMTSEEAHIGRFDVDQCAEVCRHVADLAATVRAGK